MLKIYSLSNFTLSLCFYVNPLSWSLLYPHHSLLNLSIHSPSIPERSHLENSWVYHSLFFLEEMWQNALPTVCRANTLYCVLEGKMVALISGWWQPLSSWFSHQTALRLHELLAVGGSTPQMCWRPHQQFVPQMLSACLLLCKPNHWLIFMSSLRNSKSIRLPLSLCNDAV